MYIKGKRVAREGIGLLKDEQGRLCGATTWVTY